MVPERGDDPSAVVEAFHAGDELALVELYARWSPLVYSLALGSLRDVAEAEEVTQRVFTTAWALRRAVDLRLVPLPAWLLEITRHQIADAQQARTGRAASGALRTACTPTSGQGEAGDLAARLVVADEMSRMDAVAKQVLRLALHDDLTHVQIAERLGLSLDAVRGHLGRGLSTLRERTEVVSDAR